DHDRVGTRQHLLQQQSRSARRRVDQQLARVGRHVRLDAANTGSFLRGGVRAVKARSRTVVQGEPCEAGALGIVVEDRGRYAPGSVVARQVGGNGGLPGAALGIDDQRGVQSHDLVLSRADAEEKTIPKSNGRLLTTSQGASNPLSFGGWASRNLRGVSVS